MVARKEDYIPQLVEYLRKNLQKGYKIDQLRWALVKQGYSRVAIEKAIEIIEKEFPKVKKEQKKEEISPPSVEPPKIEKEEPEKKKKGFFSWLFGRKS